MGLIQTLPPTPTTDTGGILLTLISMKLNVLHLKNVTLWQVSCNIVTYYYICINVTFFITTLFLGNILCLLNLLKRL